MILLDTNVLSEARHPGGSERVKDNVDARASDLFLSAIVMGEIRFGIALMREPARRAVLASWYASLAETYADVILPITLEIAEHWGELAARLRNVGRPLDAPDGLIAATAIVHDLTLWTRNTRDFEGTGARLFNPWED